MLAYAFALVAWPLRRRAGIAAYAAGFIVAVASVAYRGLHVGHAPLQNLFEVFLVLAMLMFPLSLFCRRVLNVGGEAVDMALGLVLLAPAGFFLSDQPQHLPPALQSVLFIPHVAAYMLAYVILTKAAALAIICLIADQSPRQSPAPPNGQAVDRLVRLGFPFLTVGLVLGAVWGKLAWGDYWNWDPKELWALACWLVYAAYFHFRSIRGRRHLQINAAIIILGELLILISLLWVNLSKLFAGLHSHA